MSRHRHKLSKKAGQPPGTIHTDGAPSTEPVRITVIDYDDAHFTEKQVDQITECFPFRDTETVTWINVDGLGNTQVIERARGMLHDSPAHP